MSNYYYEKTDMQWLPKAKQSKSGIKKALRIISLVLSSFLVFLAAYFPLTYKWSQDTWSDLTIQEIVYHLTMPAEGAATNMVSGHIIKCLIPALIITAVFIIAVLMLRRRPSPAAFVKGTAAAVSAVIIANTVAAFWTNMDLTNYIDNQGTYSSFIDSNYVEPDSVELAFPEKKRNLIYIFMESMENTFADTSVGGAFSENVIPELTQLSLENENFSGSDESLNGGVPMTGATWTMGAMFAQTSGLPLMLSIDKNAMSTQKEFFPGATTLGDILEDEGYNQTLLLGSDATFGGRKLYFETHGNYQMRDYNYYTGNGTLPSDYYVWWGYEDLHLFENAKTELSELSSKSEPFNLTMLTVDTHFEDGYVCSLCENEFDTQYSNVYKCSSHQTIEFIEWCKTQDWYEDTTIVIAGDHLTMDSDYCNDVPEDYQRTVYTTIINGAEDNKNKSFRNYTTFDMFPTTLAALGVDIPGDKLALGTNLYSDSATLLEKYSYDEVQEGLSAKSELMDNLTAGIKTSMGTLKVTDFNTETNSLQMIVSDITASGSGKIGEVKAYVGKQSWMLDRRSYVGEDRGDGSYIFTVRLEDFNFEGGTYNVTITAKDAEAVRLNEYTIAATTVEMNPSGGNAQTADTASYGLTAGGFDYATGYFKVAYNKPNAQNIAQVQFAVWKKPDQSDIRWYSAELGSDGIYSADVYAFDYDFEDTAYTIDVYETHTDGTSNQNGRISYRVNDEE